MRRQKTTKKSRCLDVIASIDASKYPSPAKSIAEPRIAKNPLLKIRCAYKHTSTMSGYLNTFGSGFSLRLSTSFIFLSLAMNIEQAMVAPDVPQKNNCTMNAFLTPTKLTSQALATVMFRPKRASALSTNEANKIIAMWT